MPALRVFLDSSDYSVLSGPEATRDPHASILQELKDFSRSGAVAFHFTGPQVAEMAPLDPTVAHSAIQRADLLVELCGRRCAISPERLITWELAGALDRQRPAEGIWSEAGDWFPGGALDIISFSPQERHTTVMETLAEQGLGRAARRNAERKLRKPAAQRKLNALLVSNARGDDELIAQIQQKYPMRAEDARVLARFAVGDGSPEEASAAFGASLGDAGLLFRWLQHQPEGADKLMAWVRAPARELSASILQLAEQADKMRCLEATLGTKTKVELLTGSDWSVKVERALLAMAQRFAKEFLDNQTDTLSIALLERHCQGLVCAVRTIYEAWRMALLRTGRKPKDSDFPDMLHTMYAPYFDIFRADSFMAPLIAKNLGHGRTKVIGKLAQLPRAIEAALSAA